MRKIIVQYGQNIFDIALMGYGNVAGVFLLVSDNNLPDGMATTLTVGQVLYIKSPPVDSAMLAYINLNNIVPVSGVATTLLATMDDGLLTWMDGGGRTLKTI